MLGEFGFIVWALFRKKTFFLLLINCQYLAFPSSPRIFWWHLILCTTALFFWGNMGVCLFVFVLLSLFIKSYTELLIPKSRSSSRNSQKSPNRCSRCDFQSLPFSSYKRCRNGSVRDTASLLSSVGEWKKSRAPDFQCTVTRGLVGRWTFCISVWW